MTPRCYACGERCDGLDAVHEPPHAPRDLLTAQQQPSRHQAAHAVREDGQLLSARRSAPNVPETTTRSCIGAHALSGRLGLTCLAATDYRGISGRNCDMCIQAVHVPM